MYSLSLEVVDVSGSPVSYQRSFGALSHVDQAQMSSGLLKSRVCLKLCSRTCSSGAGCFAPGLGSWQGLEAHTHTHTKL